MNNLPENELFTAYLDGELSAAERARVERLLAADPAARQLLEELRKVSGAVRSLPKQTIGEDLRPHILRQAERRMLTEEPAGLREKADVPTPLVRSIFRRFTTPRIIIWTTITVVFAVMIQLEQRRKDADRDAVRQEIAMATKPEPRRPVPPSSMSAVPERVVSEVADKAGEAKQEDTEGQDGANDARLFMGRAGALRAGMEKGIPGQPSPLEGVLVVQCKVSREALKQRAFEKLLADHSIVWQADEGLQDLEHFSFPGNAPAAAAPMAAEPASKPDSEAHQHDEKEVEDVDQIAKPARRLAGGKEASDESDWVYVEATPVQIEATLDGLAAQPEAFPAIAIQPAPEDAPQQALLRYNRSASSLVTGGNAVSQGAPSVVNNLAERAPEEDKPMLVQAPAQSNAAVGLSQGFAQRVQRGTLQPVNLDAVKNGLSTRQEDAAIRSVDRLSEKSQPSDELSEKAPVAAKESKQRGSADLRQQRQGGLRQPTQRVLFVLQPVEKADSEKQ